MKRYDKIKQICADSGYESEEYCCFEELKDIALFVKPSNHEQRKAKKYRTDISRRENMAYNAETDTYTCANGKAITFDVIKKTTFRRCTLCTSRKSDKIRARIFRKMPQTYCAVLP